MLGLEGKLALKTFLSSFFLFSLLELTIIYFDIVNLTNSALILIVTLSVTSILLKLIYEGDEFQIAIRASILGILFALGIYVRLVAPPHILIFGGYMCVMALFHFSEFIAISIVQPKQLSTDSFVINHSPQYIVAAVASWLEFFVECYFFPNMKQFYIVSNIGLIICITGDVLRKVSMITAGSSFHHLVQCEKSRDHVLVTHGVYAIFRHPSYVGWFYWSIGTQIILLNPFCVPAYALASWSFFKSRIYIEEITLLNFFGQSYCNYQEKVWTGIPFIKGYRI